MQEYTQEQLKQAERRGVEISTNVKEQLFEYASKEMMQAHDGLFGMESQMWERIKDNNLDYAEENSGAFQEPMSVIEQEEALQLYDAGADIYLITNFSSPMYVTECDEFHDMGIMKKVPMLIR